jgi:methyl-accepting chemotaxis protein
MKEECRMLSIRTKSIHLKFILVLLLVAGLLFSAGLVAVYQLRTILLRNTAQAVADQVIAFRNWVAGNGVVWVNGLQHTAPDFLGQKTCGDATFYSKNPALATRELSNIVAQSGFNATFRVTSDNFRNPSNRPDSFEMTAIQAFKTGLDKPVDMQLRFVEAYEGGTYRYSIPVKVAEPCLRCHGVVSDAPKEVVEKYGPYQAFYYRIGDIRGIITVDLPVISLFTAALVSNPLVLLLIAAAFLVNFLLLKRMIVDRIENATAVTERMVQGDLDMDITNQYEKNSGDEIDKVFHALDLMRKSVKIALKNMK